MGILYLILGIALLVMGAILCIVSPVPGILAAVFGILLIVFSRKMKKAKTSAQIRSRCRVRLLLFRQLLRGLPPPLR